MKSFNYVITDEIGLHARPAGMLVKESAKYESKIMITCEGRSAEARRLIAIMGLGVKQGQEVTVSAEGPDEDKAIADMEVFFKENL